MGHVQADRAPGILSDMADSHPRDDAMQRPQSISERLHDVSFPLAVRGYERAAVDEFVAEVQMLVAQLEANQTREGIVQKALDEVGVDTAGILQTAHEAANEITSRSRSQADSGLQRAEREAELVRRDAEEYAEHIVGDTRLLWEERLRLIEDIRQLADEVLATADDASERVTIPEPLARVAAEDEPTTTAEHAPPQIALASDDPAYDEGEVDPHTPTEFLDGSEAVEVDDDRTQPYEVPALEEDELEADEESDRPSGTVELEALPGGEEPTDPDEEAAPGDEAERDRD